jgi:hypothetical protein
LKISGLFLSAASLSVSPKACSVHNSVTISRIDSKLGMHAYFTNLKSSAQGPVLCTS